MKFYFKLLEMDKCGNSVITYFCFHLAAFLEEVGTKMLKERDEIAVKTKTVCKKLYSQLLNSHSAILLHGKTLC